jgi:hypothetical protein
MAKTKVGNTNQKLPVLSGQLIFRVNRGQLVAQRWPRKRSRPLHPHTVEQNQWFREACLLAKYADRNSQRIALDATRNSPLLARDILLMAMSGRHFVIDLPDGKKVIPTVMTKAVSDSLDAISQHPGSVLVRAPDGWIAIAPTAEGQIITATGPDLTPTWTFPTGGGGSSEAPSISDFDTVSLQPDQSTQTSLTGGLLWLSTNDTPGRNPGYLLFDVPPAPWRLTLGARLELPRHGYPEFGTCALSNTADVQISNSESWRDSQSRLIYITRKTDVDFTSTISHDYYYQNWKPELWQQMHSDGTDLVFTSGPTAPCFTPNGTYDIASHFGSIEQIGLRMASDSASPYPTIADIFFLSLETL